MVSQFFDVTLVTGNPETRKVEGLALELEESAEVVLVEGPGSAGEERRAVRVSASSASCSSALAFIHCRSDRWVSLWPLTP